MKKTTVAIMGLALFAGWPLMAAEQGMEGMGHGEKGAMTHMKMSDDEYCTKHCNAMELRKQIRDLDKKIEADKAAIKRPGTGDKILTIEARKNELKKNLDQLVQQQITLKTDLDKLEKELADLEKK